MERVFEQEDELDLTRNTSQESRPPLYQSPRPSNSQRSKGSSSSIEYMNPLPPQSNTASRSNTNVSQSLRQVDPAQGRVAAMSGDLLCLFRNP